MHAKTKPDPSSESADEATPDTLAEPPDSELTPQELHDLEIKDAQVIFKAVWQSLEEDYGHQNLTFPKEIILLGGAPGSGKGTQTEFICRARGLTCPPIVVSALLDSPDARKIKDQGGMVGDREVIGIILREMLKPEYRDGAILDGFPRTHVQVECLKLLVTHMNALRREFYNSPLAMQFRKPIIHIMVLFIDEKTSVERQLDRGQQALAHNKEVELTGVGQILPIRKTDLDEQAARRRYRVFKEKTWDALQSLKELFFYHFVNAQCPVHEVEQNILRELTYQSSLELDPRTFDRLRSLPLASEIIVHARQELVKRLDGYEFEHPDIFHQVLNLVEERFMPIIIRHAISGQAVVNSEAPLLDNPHALGMLIDIFSERGYHAVVDVRKVPVAVSVDLQTGEITNRDRRLYHVLIFFEGSEIRRG